jgi:hypothetical protein
MPLFSGPLFPPPFHENLITHPASRIPYPVSRIPLSLDSFYIIFAGMKLSKPIIIYLFVLIAACSLYRIVDNRPFGFAPQIAMALFGGMVIKNRLWAFALPIFSMFISDVLYQVLYVYGLSETRGFYEGQLVNYIILASVTFVGFLFRKISVITVIAGSLIGATWFYLVSNIAVWIAGAGYSRPKTFAGLIQAMEDGLPFYKGSLMATLFFSALFFGVYYLVKKSSTSTVTA